MTKTWVSRRTECWLLVWASLALIWGFGLVWKSCYPNLAWPQMLFPCALICPWFALHFMLRAQGSRADQLILPLAVFLSGLGTIFIYRLQPQLLPHHLIVSVIALACLAGVAGRWTDYLSLSQYRYTCMTLGIFLLLLTILFGRQVHGARLSLSLGPLSFQPSELVKLLLVIFMAGYLVEKRELLASAAGRWGLISRWDLRYLGPLIAMWGLTMALIVKQQDLGAALLLFGSFIVMLYLGSDRKVYPALGIGLFALGAVICYYLVSRVHSRVEVWLNPWPQAEGVGYQIVQSLFGLGFGRVLGAGLGMGYPDTIPAVHTDLPFSAIGEELGLAGAAAVICIYLLLIWRGFRAALSSNDDFSALLAAGLAWVLALQTWIIMGGAVRLVPLTGITLPFISYGGSSLLCNFILLGLLLRISARTSPPTEERIR